MANTTYRIVLARTDETDGALVATRAAPLLLTCQEAAQALGVGERTLREHIKAGTLRYIAVGRGRKRPGIRIHPDDLAAFIEDQRRSQPCPSTGTRSRRTTTTTSSSEVIAFADRLARRAAGMQKP